GHRGPGLLGRDRPLLRDLARAARGAPGSDRGAPLRVTERPAPPARRTPGAGLALGLVLVVAVGFLVVGVPLQILFGEMGIVLSQFFVLLLPAVLLVRLG